MIRNLAKVYWADYVRELRATKGERKCLKI